MTVELRPFGTRCNIQCRYCYQEPRRQAGQLAHDFDIERMKQAVLAEGGPFSVFGGEPLLVRLADLEELWAFGLEHYGRNTVQTNGTLIRDEHIDLFRKYNVAVGISLDGPGDLNDVRWAGREAATREQTARSEAALRRLLREGIATSLIVTLHRGNASPSRLDRLLDWFRELDRMGLGSARLHLLESENEAIRRQWGLSSAENITTLRRFLALEREMTTLRLDLFKDMRQMLLGDDRRATCIWKGCDPYTTRAVRGVEGNGQRSNCGRTNKEGIEFVKSTREGFERSLMLYATPQEVGGCEGCRFFLMCRGNCPGTALDGDWRNRTEHCEVWKALFEVLEDELEQSGHQPLSTAAHRDDVEHGMLMAWARGENPSMYRILNTIPLVDREFDWHLEMSDIAAEISTGLRAWSASRTHEPSLV